MNKFITGSKVYLRPYQMEDKQALYNSTFYPENRLYTGLKTPLTESMITSYISRAMEGSSDRVTFVIVNDANNESVGEVVLNEIENRKANIRIVLFSNKFYNKGFGTEAMRLMLDFGFGMLDLHRIELGVYDHNERGIHVYEKLGFKKEGILRDYLYFNHRYYNQYVMSILKYEYEELNGDKK